MWLDQGVSFQSLEEFFNTIESPYMNSLNKNIISYNNWESLMDDILKAKSDWKYKQILNEFPSIQKELITDEIKPLLISLFDRKDKENFIKKISRYKTSKELYNSLQTFINSDYDVRFKSLLSSIKYHRIELIYSNRDEDIIIVKVDNSSQLRSIAGDSSWCILNQDTFDSYNKGLYRQFVIFLTDKNDNYKKIGITYGRKFKTAHLLDDKYIGLDSLSKILNERGFDINDLKIPLDKIDFNKSGLEDLIECGFSKEELIQKKTNLEDERVYLLKKAGFTIDEVLTIRKSFNKQELNSDFTPDEVEKYNLQDKIELYHISDLKDKNLAWIINNIYRMKLGYNDRRSRDYGKIDIDFIVNINPTPREIKMIENVDKKYITKNFSEDCIEFLTEIQKSIREIRFWKFDSIDIKIYILRYKGVGPQNFEWDEVLKVFKDESINYLDKILEFLKLNGWEITTEKLIELIQNMKFGTGSFSKNPLDVWLDLLKKYPQLKNHIDKIISYCLKKDTSKEEYEEFYNFLTKNKISHISLVDIKPSNLEDYPELKKICEKEELLKLYQDVLPKYTTQNYNSRSISTIVKKISPSYKDISPEIIVDYFFPKLKNDINKIGGLNRIYMIVSLVKTNNIDKLNELNLSFSQENILMFIRILFNLESYNSTPYLREDFRLNDSEREKLCDWLVKNKNIIGKNYKNEIVDDMETYQQYALSFIYYYYNWGFQNYFNLVKKFKRQKDEWIEINNKSYHRTEINRINLFSEIFNYLYINKDKPTYDELNQKIKTEMVLKNYEIKQLEGSFKRFYKSSSSL
jgi:hypothetical protein